MLVAALLRPLRDPFRCAEVYEGTAIQLMLGRVTDVCDNIFGKKKCEASWRFRRFMKFNAEYDGIVCFVADQVCWANACKRK